MVLSSATTVSVYFAFFGSVLFRDICTGPTRCELFEFTIQKSKSSPRVGPVQMSLNKTDPKKAKYTLTVVADDKTIEKKDKTSGEPVQFYVKGSARMAPYEIVVVDVGKSQITGYLATPKEGVAAAPPAAAATPAPAAV